MGRGEAGDLAAALRAAVSGGASGDVDFSVTARALTTMDASNYRRVPLGVVAPRDADDVAAALAVCRERGVPVVARGGGTSIGGQATGTGVVFDFTRHMDDVVSLDPEARTAVVRPGLVLDRLRAAARPYGLTFGPDPSTHSRCTLGGMIGNNACGAHSVAWGTTADNVRALDVLTYDGRRLRLGQDGQGAPAGLTELVARNLAVLRTGYPAGLPRRISGYALDALLPERGADVARAFCGSEGTLGVVTEAEVRLVPLPAEPVLVVLGYADESAAADAAAGLLPYRPLTVEGMAADLVRGVSGLPRGAAWLFCEVDGTGAARELARAADALDAVVVTDPAGQRALWRIREDAAGTSTRMPDGTEAWPGWEDCAVPPARLGAYLREFRGLLAEFGLRGIPYGHFGDGCVHVRIDFDLYSGDGVRDFRRFSEAVADLVVAHGGSLSGEHGDGKARAELLPKMYGAELVGLFGEVKDLWDPDGGLNPGMLVRPEPLDSGLRFEGLPLVGPAAGLGREAARCVGVAKCRVAGPGSGPGVMCPSFRATGEEQHSTRGRARLLHEMALGEVITDGMRSEEVRGALDLCLSCKGCRSDCPVGVDMAAYKSRFLEGYYAGRPWRRPRSHWTMGGLPRLLDRFGVGLNAAHRLPFAARLAGVTPERELPTVAERSFVSWFGERASDRPPALTLWPDTFTDHLAPQVGVAAVRVLEAAGLGVALPPGRVCCGLTYVSTGRLGAARRVMRRTLDVMGEGVTGEGNRPVVVLEPSCAATLRTDLPELLPDDPRAARLAASVRTFAEALEELAPDWDPPRADRPVTGQTHCHQHAVLGDAAERRLRERAGLEGELAGGCCGLAGNFGFEPGHYEVSMACAEDRLLPALRSAPADAVVVADGFSCRTQMAHLAPEYHVRHLAEVLAEELDR